MAAKIGTKTSKKWLADPSTYPLIACIGAGAVMCFSVGVRHLTKSPDVKWNREVRKNPELALRDRSDWMSHRGDFKALASNRVNSHEK
ncbi:hypothetical protein Poli38472_004800 [Pythium oligandrum]|uniref:Uncharacterized protein n=1 Tax=Pythium oligandrum TaxID=41045 RepID=A0A8K1FER7_PYTOL|nr:hypothetical protein Poli38472_004800 [Pythium oligandrum]|eukprot:TMW59731.1 hypothetical protein Poli38472_004800 [Pythium oligandrum]